ncbi:MAG: Rieske (2Fe-2S) protein [Gammaproteobacteria bacterium]|nr:Rieske (2Fe-2S) protein [Gammaproteobacteria bacterium]
MTDTVTWIRAANRGDLADGEALSVPTPDGRTIALFFTNGEYYATDNQCPHMGFPLVRGLVRNGVVTCDWHGRSFDLAGGGCFHSQCDDVRVFQTEVREDSVWVRFEAEPENRREAWLRLLWEGLLDDDRWTMSKAIAQLLHAGVPEDDIVELIMRHVGRHVASSHDLDAGDDVSRLINGLKVGQRYEGEDRLIALTIAARSAAGPAADRNENVLMPPPYDWERTASWVRNFSRDRMGNRIERCLYTARENGDGDRILPLLLECAVEPHFLDFGDSLVSLAYLAELQELFGWERSGELIFNLGAKLIGQPRQEPERFRRDAVTRMRELQPRLDKVQRIDDEREFDEDVLTKAVTSVDILRSFDAVANALENVPIDRLITSFVLLAADRMARTPVAVDAGWQNLTRELNLASSLRAIKRRGGLTVAAKGLFHVAWHFFADRWINIDYRSIAEALDAPSTNISDEDSASNAVLDAIKNLDVDIVGNHVMAYLKSGYSGDRLLHDMGREILRDDTGQEILPTLRTVFEEWEILTGTDGKLGAGHPATAQLLVGLARYATDIRSNSDSRSAAVTAMHFAEGKTTVEMFE